MENKPLLIIFSISTSTAGCLSQRRNRQTLCYQHHPLPPILRPRHHSRPLDFNQITKRNKNA